jgi:alkyl sulfatase BDS1-like metallo-beta-lactamase superfamily hydrolase
MADLLALSARYIDEGAYEGPGSVNRVTTELSEVAPNIAVVEAFSHVIAFKTEDGLVLFDTSLETFAPAILKSLRAWADERVHTIAYTHGHVDHVGGAQIFVDEARERRLPDPRVVGQENLPGRFARYELTNGYNAAINARQFGGGRLDGPGGMASARFGPTTWVQPDTTFRDRLQLRAGGLDIELRHSKGETDDHLWAWLPGIRAICCGDLLTWVFPNAGNPQKVQRYPVEWAAAMRDMANQGAELFLPAHGLPIQGQARIRAVLTDVAEALEMLVEETIGLMNEGAPLNDIVHAVHVPQAVLDKPYLRPMYDEPEFVVRNIWRMYGGWYDGNPANLKPARDAVLANEIAALAGGADRLAERAIEVADDDMRLACHLIELAVQAEPENKGAHGARGEIYQRRREQETSLMAKGIFGFAARDSQNKAGERE